MRVSSMMPMSKGCQHSKIMLRHRGYEDDWLEGWRRRRGKQQPRQSVFRDVTRSLKQLCRRCEEEEEEEEELGFSTTDSQEKEGQNIWSNLWLRSNVTCSSVRSTTSM